MSKKLTVEIEDKTYFDSGVEALGNVNFKVEPSKFTSILGPSGCGKSTLLKLIVGLDTDYRGKIVLGDTEIIEPSKECGIVFQEPRLLPWLTTKQNIEFGIYDKNSKSKYITQTTKLLELLDLLKFENSYPNQLSGGMAQKVALARALVNLPNLLLLDEPFVSLDQITKMKLQEEFAGVLDKEKTTVLMVTHDIEEAVYLSDKILIMSNRPGRILKSFEVNLSKPRDRSSTDFIKLHTSILKYMSDTLKVF